MQKNCASTECRQIQPSDSKNVAMLCDEKKLDWQMTMILLRLQTNVSRF